MGAGLCLIYKDPASVGLIFLFGYSLEQATFNFYPWLLYASRRCCYTNYNLSHQLPSFGWNRKCRASRPPWRQSVGIFAAIGVGKAGLSAWCSHQDVLVGWGVVLTLWIQVFREIMGAKVKWYPFFLGQAMIIYRSLFVAQVSWSNLS